MRERERGREGERENFFVVLLQYEECVYICCNFEHILIFETFIGI